MGLPSDGIPWEALLGVAAITTALVLQLAVDRVDATRLRHYHHVASPPFDTGIDGHATSSSLRGRTADRPSVRAHTNRSRQLQIYG
ncbi:MULTISPECIES: hypothetical protein [unclassified Isoptericola]|uniref:hypothetical protein n=1 Tax=unclassified Isoptericola TaxID=2623355 RepID=UPI00364E071F